MRLLDMGPYGVCTVGLITNRRDWNLQRKHFDFDEPWPGDDPHTVFLTGVKFCQGSPLVIVCMPGTQRMDRRQAIGYCVHEAVHVWQFICDHIHAGKTGREIEAYSVQWISGWLIKELRL